MATFRQNLPHVPTWKGDIASLTADVILEQADLARGELDVLDGSPPCQGFSMAGRRQFADARNTLFREYVRLLADLQPKVFVMENVAGMVRGRMRLVFAECTARAEGSRLPGLGPGPECDVLRRTPAPRSPDPDRGPRRPRDRPIASRRHELAHPVRTALTAASRIGAQPGDAATPELTDTYGHGRRFARDRVRCM